LLRQYQQDALQNTRAAFANGARRVCLVSPTGSGKTRIASEMLRLAGRGLWLAHRRELVAQAYDTLTALGLRVSCVASDGIRPFDKNAPIQVASIQTLIARKQFVDSRFVVCDEFHHFAGTGYADCIPDTARVVGLTATPERGDGVGLHTIADRLVVVSQVAPLVAAGHLAPIEIIRPARKLRPGTIAQTPHDAYHAHAAGRPFLCYSASIKMAEQHAAGFAGLGYRVAVVDSTTPDDVRSARVEAFRAGDLHGLCNVNVLTEGTDFPHAEVAILARGCGTTGLYLQIVGRVRRPKASALLLDLHGASHDHGHPDDDRVYSLDGRGIRRKQDLVNQSYCRVCGACTIPGQPCGECGAAARGITTVVKAARLERYASARAQTIDRRALNLQKWMADAAAKGWSTKQPMIKYKAVYGGWPGEDVIRMARAR
jgi:superfamily II DNA or RNA helicase